MAVDSIVRVSFQSNTTANQAANNALTGHTQNSSGSGPFTRVNTACYACANADEVAVASALAQLGNALLANVAVIDFVSFTMVRRESTVPTVELAHGG